jgi:hypothetical protein
MVSWDKVRKDAQKGFKDSLTALKLKAGELTDEGKKKYKLFELKNKLQRDMAELGGLVYDLSPKGKNPLEDGKVTAIITKLKKLEEQVRKLEGKGAKKTKKTVRKKVARKTVTKKT